MSMTMLSVYDTRMYAAYPPCYDPWRTPWSWMDSYYPTIVRSEQPPYSPATSHSEDSSSSPGLSHVVYPRQESPMRIYYHPEMTTDNNMAPIVVSEPDETLRCRWLDCDCVFATLDCLSGHVSLHHTAAEGGLFYCKWKGCSRGHRGFNARYKMLVHVRTHTNEKPHKCNQCDKSFSRTENLKIHIRSHSGEKPYVCPVEGCNKAYSNSSDRFKHTRTHAVNKPYSCKVPGCQKRYTDPSSLRKHVKTFKHHNAAAPPSHDERPPPLVFADDRAKLSNSDENSSEMVAIESRIRILNSDKSTDVVEYKIDYAPPSFIKRSTEESAMDLVDVPLDVRMYSKLENVKGYSDMQYEDIFNVNSMKLENKFLDTPLDLSIKKCNF